MPPLRYGSALVLSCLTLLCVTVAEAQVFQPPSRVFQRRQPDPGRLRQELTVETHLLVGFDDSLTPPGTAVFTSRPGGSTGASDTRIRYFVGSQERSFA